MDYYGPMLSFRRLSLPALLALSLTAVAQAPASAPPEPSALDDALFYQLLLGEITLREGEAGSAFTLILDAAQKTQDERLFRRAVEIAQHARAGDAVLRAVNAWKAAFPQSSDANRQLLFTLLNLNRPADTVQPLVDSLDRLNPAGRADAIAQLPRMYARISDKVAAARAVERALKPDLTTAPGGSGLAWAVVGRMRLHAGQNALALEAAEQVAKAGDTSESATLFGLELMERHLAPGEALVERGLKGPGTDEFRLAYARLLIQDQRYRAARDVLQEAVQRNPDLETAWLILGSLQMQDRHFDVAQSSLARYVELATKNRPAGAEAPRGLAQAYFYLADLAAMRKDHAAALDWLARVDTGKDMTQARLRRAQVLARMGRLDEARQTVRDMPETDPADARTKAMTEAQLLRDAKQYRAAFDVLSAFNVGARADIDVSYEQAMLAEKLGDLAGMEKLLRTIIAVKPDYSAAYNALGYSLAERNVRLQEAKALIQKAVELAPNDPFIADSLGWVEFRLGNKSDAARILEAAFRARPDAEIATHLGEVLWTMGERERALEFLKQAKQLSPDNETLGDTLKRLQVKW